MSLGELDLGNIETHINGVCVKGDFEFADLKVWLRSEPHTSTPHAIILIPHALRPY